MVVFEKKKRTFPTRTRRVGRVCLCHETQL